MLRLALVSLVALSLPAGSPTSAEIDAQVWSAVAASVVAGDIVAMGRTYHPAAVLVSNTGTKPIATTLADWGKDMRRPRRTRSGPPWNFGSTSGKTMP